MNYDLGCMISYFSKTQTILASMKGSLGKGTCAGIMYKYVIYDIGFLIFNNHMVFIACRFIDVRKPINFIKIMCNIIQKNNVQNSSF